MSHNFNAFNYNPDTGKVEIAADASGRIAGNFANLVAATGIANNNAKGLSQVVQPEKINQISGVEVPSLAVLGVTAANATYTNSALSEGNEVGGRSA